MTRHALRSHSSSSASLAPIPGSEGLARQTLRLEAVAISPRALWLGAAVGFLFLIGMIAFGARTCETN